MKYTSIIQNLIFLLIVNLFCIASTFSQTKEVLHKKMNLQKAFSKDQQIGVKFNDVSDLTGDYGIHIQIYSDIRYKEHRPHREDRDGFLYAIKADNTTTPNFPDGTPDNPYVFEPLLINANTYATPSDPANYKTAYDLDQNYDPFNTSAPNIYKLPSSDIGSRNGTIYKHHLNKEIAYNKLFQDTDSFYNKTLEVVVELKFLGDLTIHHINEILLPGIKIYPLLDTRMEVYLNPGLGAPDKVFVVAHRGYFQGQGVPENGLKAIEKAIEFGSPMIEIDAQHTVAYSLMNHWVGGSTNAYVDDPQTRNFLPTQWGLDNWDLAPKIANDTVYFASHDFDLDNPLRTITPERLDGHPRRYTRPDGTHRVQMRNLTACDIRPDLCQQFTGCDCDPFANNGTGCDNYMPNNGRTYPSSQPCKPIKLHQVVGDVTEPMPTLQEVLDLSRENGILVNLDKIDDDCRARKNRSSPTDWSCTHQYQPYHRVYKELVDANMLDYTVVKGKAFRNTTLDNPTNFRNEFSKFDGTEYEIDWTRFNFTPTFFSEYTINQDIIDAWFDDKDFSCAGIELIFASENDPLYPWISNIRAKNKNVIAFPAYPEACDYYLDHPKSFHHYNWNWLLSNDAHRPSVLISDRLEMLDKVVEVLGYKIDD